MFRDSLTQGHGYYRSLHHFNINQPEDRMPAAIIRAYGLIKGAAATVNVENNVLGMPFTASTTQGNLTEL